MTLYDFHLFTALIAPPNPEPTFASLIMAAYRRADTGNAAVLEAAFPEIIAELSARYDAPGGYLEGDPR